MKMEQNENKSLCNLRKGETCFGVEGEVSLATHLERELTNPSMIDVCYERLYSRLIGLMRMTRESFVCPCLCVCLDVNEPDLFVLCVLLSSGHRGQGFE